MNCYFINGFVFNKFLFFLLLTYLLEFLFNEQEVSNMTLLLLNRGKKACLRKHSDWVTHVLAKTIKE